MNASMFAMQDDDAIAAAEALETEFPDAIKKNKRKKGNALAALAEAGVTSMTRSDCVHAYCCCFTLVSIAVT